MRAFSDEGLTWSEEALLNPQGEFSQVLLNDSAVRLSSGRLILPNYHGLSPFADTEFVQPMFSDDYGRTWERSEFRLSAKELLEKGGFSESSLAELPDGRLLLVSRTGVGFVYKCYSSDSGNT